MPIRKTKKGWKIDKVPGYSKTKKEAEKRLRAVKAKVRQMTTIITKNSSTGSAVPTSGDLVQGELAVNVTDKRLFTEDSGGTVVEIGTNPSSLTITGTILEDVYSWATTSGANTTDLDPDNGSIHTVTLTGNITSLTDNLSSGEAITLMIDDGTAYSITWPTMTWVNNAGSAPTLATTGYTVVALWKVSTTLYGALVGDGS